MRIDYGGVYAIFLGKEFELLGYPSCSNSLTESVKEDVTGFYLLFFQPFSSFRFEILGDIEPTKLATLGIDVEIALLNVFSLDLQQLTDTCAGGCQEPNHEVP